MTSSTVRALSDGAYFLAHGRELLAAVALEPYCLYCSFMGLDAKVSLTPDSNVTNWGCSHTSGWAARRRAIELPELLSALNWGIRCTACKGNAAGDNSPTDTAFKVLCGCTSRLMVNPRPKPVGLPPVERLGR